MFKPYCKGEVYQYEGNSILTGPYNGFRFNTLCLPCFYFFYDLFYSKGVKTIPHNIIEYLSAISLAT